MNSVDIEWHEIKPGDENKFHVINKHALSCGDKIFKCPFDGKYRVLTEKQFLELKEMHERYKNKK